MLSPEDLEKLKKAGAIAAQALRIGMDMVREGVKLYDVAQEVESYVRNHGAKPAFPCNLSLNEVAAHYTPSVNDRTRFDIGDVVKVDVGAHIDGYVGDTAGTVEVGTKTFKGLIESSVRARDKVMEFIGDGCPMNEVGRVVDESMRQDGFRPIANLTGHEIKPYNLHSGLSVPNIDDKNTTPIKKGMVLAIEPFATNGKGMIMSAKLGNIYKIARDRPISDPDLKEFYDHISNEFRTFPFCERWCDHPKAGVMLNKLLRHGLITTYPQLTEMKRGCVTQSEHTVYVEGKNVLITTLP
ncbi:MAG: type II methionyl aminopeptidase [Methanomassiliicoccaceae archaeon]|jgi:methionyl aminopeptidase|nr:type II methionyl aminopeptidase [Methanomassiliicoccaceae archaeon]